VHSLQLPVLDFAVPVQVELQLEQPDVFDEPEHEELQLEQPLDDELDEHEELQLLQLDDLELFEHALLHPEGFGSSGSGSQPVKLSPVDISARNGITFTVKFFRKSRLSIKFCSNFFIGDHI